ncbi:MAG: GspH/FimT family pseudopilin [Hyphomonas sp.]
MTAQRRAETGMSLVEVLVALSIVAITTTVITLTLAGPNPLARESDHLRGVLEQTAGRALVTGRPTALLVDGRSYSPAIWQDGEWRVAGTARHTLPSGMALIASDNTGTQRRRRDDPKPMIVFDPLGHSPDASIDLVRGGSVTRFTLQPGGQVIMETP